MRIRFLIVAFLVVHPIQIILNKPAPQPVQAQQQTKPPQSAPKASKEKVVKDASTKKKAKPVAPKAVTAPTPVVVTPPANDGSARGFIFSVESGNRLDATNPGGCYGLGQDCNDVLRFACPNWRTDRPCQERFWEASKTQR